MIRGYLLQQVTIDPLDDTSIMTIYQYLSKQFPIISLQIENSQIFLYCGLYKNGLSIDQSSTCLDYFDKHVKHICPPTISLNQISGYQMLNLSDIISSDTDLVRYYAFSKVDIMNLHSKILKILLEISGLTLIYASNSLDRDNHYLTIKLIAESKEKLDDLESALESNLKKTPYISGKLDAINRKYISHNTGLISLGITPINIERRQLNSFLLLVPPNMSPPDQSYVCDSLPLIDQIPEHDPLGNNSPDNEIIRSISQNKIANNQPVTKNQSNTNINSLISILHLHGWSITKTETNQSPSYSSIIIENEALKLMLITDLKNNSLPPSSLNIQKPDLCFLLVDNSHSNKPHEDWNILNMDFLDHSVLLFT